MFSLKKPHRSAFSSITVRKLIFFGQMSATISKKCQTFPLRGNTVNSFILEEAADLWILTCKDHAAVVSRGRKTATHLRESFNGVGKDGFLHVHGNSLQAHYAVQHAKNSLVLALFLQKSKSNKFLKNASRN